MHIQFASSQWNPYARGFIQKMYPSRKVDDAKLGKLIDLVNRDVLRVQDPDFHKPCGIIAGQNYESGKDEVSAAIDEFKIAMHGPQE